MQRPARFMAQDDYVVTQATYLSDFDQRVAINLYQPLVGPVALALYLTFWQEVTPHPVLTDRRPQTRLLDLLNIDVDELYDARVKLEAVGLLKTYTDADQMSRYYAYELYAPATPDQFFNDDLLGMLLYDRVGQAQYLKLAEAFTLKSVRRPTWQDDTHSFLDVFHMTNVLAEPTPVQQVKQDATQKEKPTVTLSGSETYDWQLLAELVQGTGLQADQLDANREALYQIAKFYGLNPPALARLIGKATDITGKLNIRQARQFAEQSYTKQNAAFTAETGEDSASVKKASATDVNLTAAEQQLLQRAKSMPPREFLAAAKQAKNAKMYPATNEINAVRRLAQRNVFDSPTLNILIDYILQSRDNIQQALLDAIANRWLKDGVDSPEKALAQIRDYTAQQNKPKPRRNGRGGRKEQTPAWLKPGYQAETKPVTAQSKDAINKRLAELKKLQEKGGQA